MDRTIEELVKAARSTEYIDYYKIMDSRIPDRMEAQKKWFEYVNKKSILTPLRW